MKVLWKEAMGGTRQGTFSWTTNEGTCTLSPRFCQSGANQEPHLHTCVCCVTLMSCQNFSGKILFKNPDFFCFNFNSEFISQIHLSPKILTIIFSEFFPTKFGLFPQNCFLLFVPEYSSPKCFKNPDFFSRVFFLPFFLVILFFCL